MVRMTFVTGEWFLPPTPATAWVTVLAVGTLLKNGIIMPVRFRLTSLAPEPRWLETILLVITVESSDLTVFSTVTANVAGTRAATTL